MIRAGWRRLSLRLPLALLGAVALCGLAYNIWFVITAPPLLRVQYIPDDAFYYLLLARHRVLSGAWTVDGANVTTGFHLLHASVLAGLYAATRGDGEAFVRHAVLLSAIGLIPAAAISTAFVLRAGRLFPALVWLVFVLSRNVALNVSSVMEWSWVVSLAAIYLACLGALSGQRWRAASVCLFVCALLGTLGRSDFGLLPAAMLAASLTILRWPADVRRAHVIGAAAGLLGASVGVALVLGHDVAVSGRLLQSSAAVKWSWLREYRPSALPILFSGEELFGPAARTTWVGGLVILSALFVLGVTAWMKRRPADDRVGASRRIMWVGGILSTGGYVLVYAFNPAGVQHWYTANLIVPLFAVLAIPALEARSRHPLLLVATCTAIVLAVRQVPQVGAFAHVPAYAHQRALAEGGRYLSEHPPGGRIGAWNSGVVGYYQGGDVVNLDGLVNNSAAAFVMAGRLPDYVDATSIKYIIDFPLMLESAHERRAGGYDDPTFLSRLRPIKHFGERTASWDWDGLTLYEVKPRARDR